ncbi:hypothetical protein GCM10023340_39070 [Nocardioides marinquilinus]|uniref:DNA-binding protein n=1 Tax=Nocardioides marinquilinus TaxID=1210400 RepID=A0ABP9Q2A5_9ACTN
MSPDDRLTTREVAELIGVVPGTWRDYVARGTAPAADGRHDARTPFWLRSTIETWQADRWGTPGRPPKNR